MIGLVGPEDATAALAAAIDISDLLRGDAAGVVEASPTVAVAVGDEAVASLVRAGLDAPLVPVETSATLAPIPRGRVPAVLDEGLADGFRTSDHPLLRAAVGPTRGRAVFDAMLVTAEPARISEYTVEGAGWRDRFRADGVVVSTSAGSAGYSRALGGPVLDPDAAGLAVVPVAPFTRRATHRVADVGQPLAITVERDEGDVSLLADGRPVGRVPPGRPVTVGVDGAIETVHDLGG